ncbi:Cytochrome P450 family protein [Ceratobasidium theobromae]|uniref:Cytochrome P450 family protein n=1 Tax=Ceratobasidium theobromae TaxID=1582974 RepID=A0A5N5QM07_9AGAM|nr:Cytochrome P450 family protein [Ceratobasidium theobromae]
MAYLANNTIYSIPSTLIVLLVVSTCIGLAISIFARRSRPLIQLPGPPAGNWTTGHFKNIMGLNGIEYQEQLVVDYGPTMKLNGAFGSEFLRVHVIQEELIYTIDPGITYAVLVKDKARFERARGLTLFMRSVWGGGLPTLPGNGYLISRSLVICPGRALTRKCQLPIFTDIAKQTCQGIKDELKTAKSSSNEVDVFPWATVAALELIGEAGLGYSFNSFTGERNKYHNAIKSVAEVAAEVAPFAKILPFVYKIGTPSFRRWALKHVPWDSIQRLRYAVEVQNQQAEEVLRAREALIASGDDLSSHIGRGRDIMTLLMKANEEEGSEFHIDRDTMVGHMNNLVFAGHETSSTAVARILGVLANLPDVQEKLREEVDEYFEKTSGESGDGLLELPYLDAIVREALRLYGPVPFIVRVCCKDSVVSLDYPVETPTGKISSLLIKKGTRIIISTTMSNRYWQAWGDRAHEFFPERWITYKHGEVTQPGIHLPGVYSSMITFGGGSHACIGFKFAVMEIKVMISQLIKKFKFEPSQEELEWEVSTVQFPYLRKERNDPDRRPKLPLKVVAI